MELQGFKRRTLHKYTTCHPWNEERDEEELRKAFDAMTSESILNLLMIHKMKKWSFGVLTTTRPKVLSF